MKALILSDSHGFEKELEVITERHQHEVDLLIHCGDSELPKDHSVLQRLNVVKGNCDGDANFPKEWIDNIDGVGIYATHGHLLNVKMTLLPLQYRAEEVNADIACFGHTHVATAFETNGVIFINPGSIRKPLTGQKQTYCILKRKDFETIVTFYEYSGNVIECMTKRFTKSK
ncbi:metallophosphoesterase [bacterium LRH843]|nr:metallophosphoesterase [bacterium LRH843]